MQEIIVYRNPIEAAFWNSAISTNLFVVLIWVFVFFISFIVMDSFSSRFVRRFSRNAKIASNVSLLVGAVVATAIIYFIF